MLKTQVLRPAVHPAGLVRHEIVFRHNYCLAIKRSGYNWGDFAKAPGLIDRGEIHLCDARRLSLGIHHAVDSVAGRVPRWRAPVSVTTISNNATLNEGDDK